MEKVMNTNNVNDLNDMNKIFKNIKLLILDVDGVLTDGGLYFDEDGKEIKRFNALDGHGIKMLMENGIEVAIISARENKTVEFRAKNLGIKHCYLGQSDKKIAFEKLKNDLNITNAEVGYMGDDIIDLPVMTKVGVPIAVANAHDEVKKRSTFITYRTGGNGAVREVCDEILKSQGLYDSMLKNYLD
jgi:3-deoxy-D-manno-octulosonate 8-phosphate phosphatase (KDO 8-P phosphatase)